MNDDYVMPVNNIDFYMSQNKPSTNDTYDIGMQHKDLYNFLDCLVQSSLIIKTCYLSEDACFYDFQHENSDISSEDEDFTVDLNNDDYMTPQNGQCFSNSRMFIILV